METVVCLAGFGDNSSIFEPLQSTTLSDVVKIVPVDLPGFGKPASENRQTTLESLAEFVVNEVTSHDSSILLAHSLSSIIASLAAPKSDGQIRTIISLEGNLTQQDAYFSAEAAKHLSADSFHRDFMFRLSELGNSHPMYRSYQKRVSTADKNALWELGCDAHKFGTSHIPGNVLIEAANVQYLYSRNNLSESSILWLEQHDIPRIELPGATHWISLFQPQLLADAVLQAIDSSEGRL